MHVRADPYACRPITHIDNDASPCQSSKSASVTDRTFAADRIIPTDQILATDRSTACGAKHSGNEANAVQKNGSGRSSKFYMSNRAHASAGPGRFICTWRIME
jgi:hypothetical protein